MLTARQLAPSSFTNSMQYLLFYLVTVFIWGSTWIGIKMQLGIVDPMISVGYRFSLAALLLFAWCLLRRHRMRFTTLDHLFMALQGFFLFAMNYFLFYLAELHITSGLAAVIFSTILLMNMMNGSLFLGSPIDQRVFVGGLLGLTGIVLVFKQEISAFDLANEGLRGTLLCIAATYLASIGNIISARNQKKGLPVVQTNAYGMSYGALLMLLLAVCLGKKFTIELTPVYLGSLFYLALFGSVIAFGCYLSLIGTIGADRAAYATLLFPLVALAISTIWEGYRWSPAALSGVALILFGNLLMLGRKKRAASPPAATAGTSQGSLSHSPVVE